MTCACSLIPGLQPPMEAKVSAFSGQLYAQNGLASCLLQKTASSWIAKPIAFVVTVSAEFALTFKTAVD